LEQLSENQIKCLTYLLATSALAPLALAPLPALALGPVEQNPQDYILHITQIIFVQARKLFLFF
jgi:hypothetical protein